jgi:hypothetical protein
VARSTVVIVIPGVMQKLVTAAPIPEGILLYKGLLEVSNVLLVTDDNKETTDHWLRLENLTKHGTVLYGTDFPEEETRRVAQVNQLRNHGFTIDMVIEPDPSVASNLIRGGYTVCNFLHRLYAFPSWRPDFEGEGRKWEEIERQVEKDALMKAEDKRLEQD